MGRRGTGRATAMVSTCRRCGQDILPGQRLVKHRGDWIHRGCASGGDDR